MNTQATKTAPKTKRAPKMLRPRTAALRFALPLLTLWAVSSSPLQAAPPSAAPHNAAPHNAAPHNAKPAAASTQMPNPQAYKAGTPERAVAEFLATWHGKDFSRMAQLTMITWRHYEPAPVPALKKQFTPASLLSAKIIGVGQDEWSPKPTENIVNLKTLLRYRSYNGLHTQTVSITVIRELSTYVQNKAGTWGVNPEFTVELDK